MKPTALFGAGTRAITGGVLGLVLAGLAYWVGLPATVRFLAAGGDLKRADAIAVFPGDFPYRARHAAALYHAGYAPMVIAAGGLVSPDLCAAGLELTRADLTTLILTDEGVPAEAVRVVAEGTNAEEEAAALRPLMSAYDIRRLIAVSSPYDMRRVAMLTREALAETGVEVVPSPSPLPAGRDWWRTKEGLLHLNNEVLKLVYHSLPTAVRQALTVGRRRNRVERGIDCPAVARQAAAAGIARPARGVQAVRP